MNVLKTPRNIIIAIILVLALVLSYKYWPAISATLRSSSPQAANEPDLRAAKEISATATYTSPAGEDNVRFTLSLDGSGVILDAKATDALDQNASNPNLEKFSTNLTLVLKGKKLSELKSIDKVGTSSLTTAAFNSVLPDLKKQL